MPRCPHTGVGSALSLPHGGSRLREKVRWSRRQFNKTQEAPFPSRATSPVETALNLYHGNDAWIRMAFPGFMLRAAVLTSEVTSSLGCTCLKELSFIPLFLNLTSLHYRKGKKKIKGILWALSKCPLLRPGWLFASPRVEDAVHTSTDLITRQGLSALQCVGTGPL